MSPFPEQHDEYLSMRSRLSDTLARSINGMDSGDMVVGIECRRWNYFSRASYRIVMNPEEGVTADVDEREFSDLNGQYPGTHSSASLLPARFTGR